MQLAENVIKSSTEKAGVPLNGNSHVGSNPAVPVLTMAADRIAAGIKEGV
jgi:hypothetical protein